MKDVKIVIGANYGDEGKGQMTYYFSSNAKKPLVILTNGGSQRGHTVISKDDRHVFSHFGSGTFNKVPSYFPKYYILNPIKFNEEYLELKKYNPQVYVNEQCRVTTPFDILLNILPQSTKGNSCGCGIWETVLRYRKTKSLNAKQFYDLSYIDKLNYLRALRDKWFLNRLDELDLNGVISKGEYFLDDDFLRKWIKDFNEMCSKITFTDNSILKKFKTLIFENAQGLCIGEEYAPNLDHATPSATGVKYVLEYLKDLDNLNIEVCYVTRTYLTRHGQGELPNECFSENISDSINEQTNITILYQGHFRYAPLDCNSLKERIELDFSKLKTFYPNAQLSLCVTHIDEYVDEYENYLSHCVNNSYRMAMSDNKIYIIKGEK